MYKCNNCKNQFVKPNKEYEPHNLDTPPYEKREYCPYCESEDIGQLISELEDNMSVYAILLRTYACLNDFVSKVEAAFDGADIFSSTKLDKAQIELWEGFWYHAGKLEMPTKTESRVEELMCDMKSENDAAQILKIIKELA